MSPRLRNIVFLVGTVLAGGVSYTLLTPTPASRTMLELRDAGIMLGQPVVVETPERLTPQAKRRIRDLQPGLLRPRQTYAHVARTARCFGDKFLDGGVGNCVRPDGGTLGPFIAEVREWRYTDVDGDGGRYWLRTSGADLDLADGGKWLADRRNDGGLFERVVNDARQAELVVPSLRRDLVGVDLDAGESADDAGDSDAVDDSLQYRADELVLYHCSQWDELVDAGAKPNPYASRFCAGLNRLALVPSPCVIPLCLSDAGTWDDNAVVDCRGTGPYGDMQGNPRWRGCNATPREYAVGSACVPVECSVIAGDDLVEEWR